MIPVEVEAGSEQWKKNGREQNKRLDYQLETFFSHSTLGLKSIQEDQRTLAPIIVRPHEEMSLRGKAEVGLLVQTWTAKTAPDLCKTN